MAVQAAETPFESVVWHFDAWPWIAEGRRWKAYLGAAVLVVYEYGDWLIYVGPAVDGVLPIPRASAVEPAFELAKRRSFNVYRALVGDLGGA